MHANVYQHSTSLTWTQKDPDLSVIQCVLGLTGESGEIAEKLKKAIRSGKDPMSLQRDPAMLKELGDVQYYLAQLAAWLDFPLEQVMETNLKKLADRKERGVLHGEGDER